MIDANIIQEVIYSVIDDLNLTFPVEKQLLKSPDTILDDGSGVVDSLGLTMLIVAIEQKMEEKLGVSISLAAEHFRPDAKIFFKSIQTLSEHISLLVNQTHAK